MISKRQLINIKLRQTKKKENICMKKFSTTFLWTVTQFACSAAFLGLDFHKAQMCELIFLHLLCSQTRLHYSHRTMTHFYAVRCLFSAIITEISIITNRFLPFSRSTFLPVKTLFSDTYAAFKSQSLSSDKQ